MMANVGQRVLVESLRDNTRFMSLTTVQAPRVSIISGYNIDNEVLWIEVDIEGRQLQSKTNKHY